MKQILFIVALLTNLPWFSLHAQDSIPASLIIHSEFLSEQVDSVEQTPTLADSILTEAKRHLGKRYRHGTAGPNTFDCSGFTSYVMGQFGINLSRSSSYQYTQGKAISRDNMQPGDLIFFTGRTSRRVGHVGIVVSVEPERHSFHFIHASCSRGITINDFASSSYYLRRYVGVRRVLQLRQ